MVDNEMKPFGYLRKFTLGPKGSRSAKSPCYGSKSTFSMIFKVPVITFDLKMTDDNDDAHISTWVFFFFFIM